MEGDWLRARQRLQGIRRRRRGRPHRIGGGAGLAWRTSTMASNLGSGHYHPSAEQNGDSSTESNSTCGSIFQREENSIPKSAVSHSSSSVIAQLMGLDELPPCRVDPKEKGTTAMGSQNPSFGVFQDKYILEVIETSEVEKKNLPSFSSCGSNLTFRGRNFIDENFSSYDSHERTKENNEVIEDQNCYEECAVKGQQQPSSLFRKDLPDMKWFELSHHSRHATNAKSLNGSKDGRKILIYKFEGKTGRSLLDNAKRSDKKLTAARVLHSLRDQRPSLSIFAKLWCSDKNDTCTQRRKIILLKPSLEKADSKRRRDLFPMSNENISLCKRRQTTHSRFVDAQRSNGDGMPTYVKTIGGIKSKGSREIAREMTQYMRQSISNDYREGPLQSPSRHFKKEVYELTRYNLHNQDASQKSPGLFSAWRSSTPSIASSTEFMRREVRNEKMGYQSEALYHDSCTRTLQEMFALSDDEAPRGKNKFPTAKRSSDLRSSPSANKPPKFHYSSFSNPNIHNDCYLINLPKYASLSGFARNNGSSRERHDVSDNHLYAYKDMPSLELGDFMHRNVGRISPPKGDLRNGGDFMRRNIGHGESPPKGYLRNNSNKFHSFKFAAKEDKLPLQKMPTHAEELKQSYMKLPEFNVFNFSDDNTSDSGNDLFVSNSTHINKLLEKSMDITLKTKDKDRTSDDEISCDNQEEPFVSHWSDGLSFHMDGMNIETQSLESSNESMQSSPVSILDLPLMEDNSDLSTQFRISKLDSDDACINKAEVLTLDNNENTGDFQSLQVMDNMEDEFINDEDRDFSYLLDMLIVSGIYGADQYKLYSTGCFLKFPVGFGVFEKLEKKYSKLVIWLRSERKVFFDFINSILAEILAPCIDMHPWVNCNRKIGPMWGSEGLLEKAWQMFIRKREELGLGKAEEKVLDGLWFSLGDDIDEIGWEIERMILEELLEELLREL